MDIEKTVNDIAAGFEAFKSAHSEEIKELKKKGSVDPLITESINNINDFLDLKSCEKQKQFTLKTIAERFDEIESALARGVKGEKGDATAAEIKQHEQAFKNYMRKGVDAGLGELQVKSYAQAFGVEEKALSVGSEQDGGYTVTPAMSASIIKSIFESSPIRALASVQTISTDSLEILDDHDEAGSGWVSETGTRSETTTPILAKRIIPTHELYAEPRATQKLLDDSFVNIEQWLADKVAAKFARDEATAFVSGNGVGKPRGFLSYAAGTAWGQVEQVNSGTSGALTADGLINLLFSLKDEYQRNAIFAMNRLSVRDVRKFKDSTNQYLWQPSYAAGTPDTILGRPVVMASDIPTASANSLSVAVADWRQAYQVVDRLGIRTIRDQFTAKPFVKFYSVKRVGGDVTNFEAIKLLKLA